MKTLIALVVFSHLAIPIGVFGRGGNLPSPVIRPGKDATEQSTAAVLELLHKKCGFVKGEVLNDFQMMDFAGSARIIPELLQLLIQAHIDAALITAHLNDTNVTFRIQQFGRSPDARTRVIVNLDYPHPDRSALAKQLGVELGPMPTTPPSTTNAATRTIEPSVGRNGKRTPKP